MEIVKLIGGGAGLALYDYSLAATVVEGQPVLAAVTAGLGGAVTDPTATSLADMVGIVVGAAAFNPHGGGAGSLTYSTTQGDTEGMVRVVVNPDAVIRARMSGGAAAGTNLTRYTAASADTGGTSVTDADATTSMDEGILWFEIGANVGLARRITAHDTGTGAFTLTVPFPRAIAAGDTFLVCPYQPTVGTALQLTTNWLEANASIAVGTGGAARAVELVLEGRGDSYVHWVARDHAFNELS